MSQKNANQVDSFIWHLRVCNEYYIFEIVTTYYLQRNLALIYFDIECR